MVSFGIFRILDLLFFSSFHGYVSEMGQIFRFRSKTLKPFNNSQPNFTDVLIRSCSGAFWPLEIFRNVIFPGFHGKKSYNEWFSFPEQNSKTAHYFSTKLYRCINQVP